jgi:NAD-dependent deacetylase
MLVVGTSGLVYPAAGLPVFSEMVGATVIEVNPEPTDISRIAHITLRGPSGEMLPQLVEALDE